MYETVPKTPPVNTSHRVNRSLSQPARSKNHVDHQYTEVDEHTWKYNTESNRFESPVLGFGNVPIPSYDNIAKLPDRKISIRVLTWNINEKPVKILELIVDQLTNIPRNSIEDVISIALQEISPGTKTFHEDALQMVAQSLVETHEIYFSYRMWSQMVLIFIRKSHIRFAIQPLAKFISSATVPKPVRTKGAIGVCFRLYQRWIVIIACHLSHASVQQRVQDYHKIMRCLKFPTLMNFKGSDNILHADVVIWVGDLNFRVNIDIGVTWTNNHITRQQDAEKLLQTDDLQMVQQKGLAFLEFSEAPIAFPPTHKYELGKNEFATKRIPSYTDRILYWCRRPEWIETIIYDSIQTPSQSDHRAVYGTFKLIVINKPIPQRFYSERQGQ